MAATWKEKASAVGVPSCRGRIPSDAPQAAAGSDRSSPMPSPRGPCMGFTSLSLHPSPLAPVQPVTLTAQSLTEVTWLTEGAKAHVGWADRSAHHRHPSICRLHAAHTPAVAQPQPPAGERLVPVRFSNPIKQRSGPARACGHVIRTAASVFTRPAWHVCVQISLLFQGHRP